jgi:hypothetical protein
VDAVQFDGPLHFVRPLGSDDIEKAARSKTGTTELKHFLLRKLGHALVVIPYWEWDAVVALNRDSKREYLRRKLNLHLDDVAPEVVQRAAATIGAFTREDYLKAERSGRLSEALAGLQGQASAATALGTSRSESGEQEEKGQKCNSSSLTTAISEKETTVGAGTCGQAKWPLHAADDGTEEELHVVCKMLGLFTREAFEVAEECGVVTQALKDMRRQKAEVASRNRQEEDRSSSWRPGAEPSRSSISGIIRSIGATAPTVSTARAKRKNGAGPAGKACPRGRSNVNAFASLERQESECF